MLNEIPHVPQPHLMKTNDVWIIIFEKLKKLVKLDIEAHIVGTQSDLFFEETRVTVKD